MSADEDWKNEERQKIDVLEVWNEVQKTIEDERKDRIISRNSRWKTIRIFVSSTFKDFHTERDVLVKEVFPDLREWCQKRDLNLVECDLRWGVPEETPYSITLQICLSEIRRCEQENVWPFFINMTSKRIGWIPVKDELPAEVVSEYNLVIGLSVTEMEIVEAAYRKGNPNSLFLYRDESFIDEMTDENVKKEFIDELNPIADKKLKKLKERIESRFPNDQVIKYTCSYIPDKKISSSGRTRLVLSEHFKTEVLEFFKKRIDQHYPRANNVKLNQFEIELNQQDAFMQNRAGLVIGRDELINEVKEYLTSDRPSKPFILVGDPGSGKSSIMAKLVHDLLQQINGDDVESSTDLIFFHFVGAVPNSTELVGVMKRFLHEMKQFDIPCKSNDVYQCVKELLQSRCHFQSRRKICIFIDALNQLDKEDLESVNTIFSWLPSTLPIHVKCIVSMTPDSPPHRMFLGMDANSYTEKRVPDLPLLNKGEIVKKYLMNYRKKLSEDQLLSFLGQAPPTANPLWMIVACDELRLYGEFRNLTDYIRTLPSTLNGLLLFVLKRICNDIEDKELLIATLCLLECSQSGLLEVELLEILADLDTKTNYEDLCQEKKSFRPRLIPWKWSSIFRHIKMFIRPYGDLGEGRLDFYHRSMSKVVHENYLPMSSGGNPKWEDKCHQLLAVHFETSPNLDRKIEEYPHHIIYNKDKISMKKFLLDWNVFDELYNSELSKKLLSYWRFIDDDYAVMYKAYKEAWDRMRNQDKVTNEVFLERGEKLARLFDQAGLVKESYEMAKDILNGYKQLEKTDEIDKQIMYLTGLLAYLEWMHNRNADESIKLREETIERIRMLPNHEDDYQLQKYLALQYNQLAFVIAEKIDKMTLPLFKQNQKYKLKEKALDYCNKAANIYDKIKDASHKLDTDLTKAELYSDPAESHRILETVIEECKAIHGPEHILIMRASNNNAIFYEREKKLNEAYKYYKIAYLLGKHILGPRHEATLRYKSILLENKFKKISTERKEDIENMVWDRSLL